MILRKLKVSRLLLITALLLLLCPSVVHPFVSTSFAATYYTVNLVSEAFDGANNIGSIWVQGWGDCNPPSTIYLQSGESVLVVGGGGFFGGGQYGFDHWEAFGGVSVSSSSQEQVTVSATGEGTLKLWLFKWEPVLDVSPTSRTTKQGGGATYQVTVTAIGRWTTNVPIQVEILNTPPGATTSFDGHFMLSESKPSDTKPCVIMTSEIDTPVGTYPITFEGTVWYTTTTDSKTVDLVVEPKEELLPDLIIEDFWWSPANPQLYDEVTFTYIEKNQGQGDASAHRNTLSINDYSVSNDVVEALEAGSSRTRTFPDKWKVETPGAHDALVKADDQKIVEESDEENNFREETIGTKEQVSTSLTINLEPSSIAPTVKAAITISGWLKRMGTGAGIADRSIRLDWTGGLTTVTTNANGYYSHSTDVGPYTKGTYEFTARFEGYETSSTIFYPSTASDYLSVDIIATELTITLDSSVIEENTVTDITMRGRLTKDDTGVGLGNEAINLNYGWGGSASATTDEDGYYLKTVRVSLSSGRYIISASFEGDEVYGSSSDTTILHVQEVSESDLIILDIFWDPEDPSHGDKVFFSYVIKNSGLEGTTDFTNALYIDGERIGTSARRSMGAGETLNRSFTYGWTAIEGSHNVTVIADDLNEIPESNEHNNRMSKTAIVLPVLEIPDLQDWYLSSYDVKPGETIRCYYQIHNPNSYDLMCWFGASVIDPNGQVISDKLNDISITLKSGIHWYSRNFTFPITSTQGAYDYSLAIWKDKYITQWKTTGWIENAIAVDRSTKLKVSTTSVSKEIIAGESATEMVIIHNAGFFELNDVELSAYGETADWIGISQTYFSSIPPVQSRLVSITISTPEWITEGDYTGTIRISSGNGGSEDIAIIVQVKPPWVITPLSIDVSAKPGEVLINEITILNMREVKIQISPWFYGEARDWIFSLVPLDIPPGSTEILPIVTCIPPGTEGGNYTGEVGINARIKDSELGHRIAAVNLNVQVLNDGDQIPIEIPNELENSLDDIASSYKTQQESYKCYISVHEATPFYTIVYLDSEGEISGSLVADSEGDVCHSIEDAEGLSIFDPVVLARANEGLAPRHYLQRSSTSMITSSEFQKMSSRLSEAAESKDTAFIAQILVHTGETLALLAVSELAAASVVGAPLLAITVPILVIKAYGLVKLFSDTSKLAVAKNRLTLMADAAMDASLIAKDMALSWLHNSPNGGYTSYANPLIDGSLDFELLESVISIYGWWEDMLLRTDPENTEAIESARAVQNALREMQSVIVQEVGDIIEVKSTLVADQRVRELEKAIEEERVGAFITIEAEADEGRDEPQFSVEKETYTPQLDVEVEVKPGKVIAKVVSNVPDGRTIIIDIENEALPISEPDEIMVLLDGEEVFLADDYTDVLDSSDESVPEYLILMGGQRNQILISIPSFSTRVITISKRAMPADLFDQTYIYALTLATVVAAAIGIPTAIALIRRGRAQMRAYPSKPKSARAPCEDS